MSQENGIKHFTIIYMKHEYGEENLLNEILQYSLKIYWDNRPEDNLGYSVT